MAEININEILDSYNEFRKKYKELPTYEELDKNFTITQYILYNYNAPIKSVLLLAIQNAMILNKINPMMSLLGDILYNNSPDIANIETKKLLENNKNEILKEHTKLIILYRKSVKVYYENEDDTRAKFIREVYDHFMSKRTWLINLITKNIKHLELLDLDKKFNDSSDNIKYYG